jgi:ribonuclease HII
MGKLAEEYPVYGWCKNKGYPTKVHVAAIREHGYCDLHRKNFCVKELFRTLGS